MKHYNLWAATALVALIPAAAFAQFGLTLGTEYGLGGYARFGNRMAVEVGAGLAPVLVLNLTVAEESRFYLPPAVGAKVSVPLRGPDHENPLGLKFGVTHNGILKTGFGGGIDYLMSRSPDVIVGGGIMYYPDAQQGLTDRVNKDSGTNYRTVVEEGVSVQPVLSISIFWTRGS